MYLTKKYLPRRTVLRGMGAAISLPLLDAMIPAATALAKTAAAPKPHMMFVYFPHGAIMDKWTPTKQGPDFDILPILEPLSPFKKQLTVVTGLENKHAEGPVHAITPGTWLSAVTPRASHDPYGGVTIDQIAALHISQDTPMPSIEASTEDTKSSGAGTCDRNYGCTYGATIAFRTPSTPLPMEANPRLLFQRLFGQGDTPTERKELADQYSSLLDLVSAETNDLKKTLGASDRAMLDDYLDTVSEIERRVNKMQERDLSKLDLPTVPAGIPSDFEEHINLMFDMIALSYQANLTRVGTLMMAAEVSNMTYNQIGVPDAFHPLSHHQNNAQKMTKLAKIQTYHSKILARFLDRLAKMPDGDGSMLDHSIVLYGSNMSNSNAHNHFPLPTAVIGGGCGKIKGNQHVACPDRTPVANLLLTLLRRAGVDIDAVGDSTGELAEI
jgi:Protein of unknown function (DUF1552)